MKRVGYDKKTDSKKDAASEYLDNLTSQIRCAKARPFVEKELRNHLDEQIEANMADGMDEEEARASAVADMGDPVEVGIAMDRIHRPRLEWRLLILVAIISAMGILFQEFLLMRVDASVAERTLVSSHNYIPHVIIGVIAMAVVYRIDYTVIAKYARIIGILLLITPLISLLWFSDSRPGVYISLGDFQNVRIQIDFFMYLYIPVYGAILYKFYGKGISGLVRALIWLEIPIFLCILLPATSLAAELLVALALELTLAIVNGWFKLSKKKAVAGVWGIVLGIPVVLSLVTGVTLMARAGGSYAFRRIVNFLGGTDGIDYMTAMRKGMTADIGFINGNGKAAALVDGNSDYILTYLVSMYGVLITVIAVALVAVIIAAIFHAVFKQKNQLGLLIGFGCGLALLLKTVLNILINLNILPPGYTSLPFLSAGGANVVLSYIFVGLVLGIYRYKDIYPKNKDVSITDEAA